MSKEKIYKYEGKKYALIEDKEPNECERCALKDKCHEKEEEEGLICTDLLGIPTAEVDGCRFIEIDEDALTEEKVYDYYQERSTTAGSRADQLAWMFIVMMTGVLISGHTYQAFSVCAALSAIYMLLSVMQAVWQTFTSWLFMKQIRKADVMPNDYPSWVGGGAWLFFWLKMISISAAVCYFVYVVFS